MNGARILGRVSLVAALVLASKVASAQAPAANVEQAKIQFNLGAQAYTAARYDVAVAAFDEAYRLLPRPEILFSLAQAEKKQCVVAKDAALLKKALGHYRQYYGTEIPGGGRKPEAVESIQYLEQLATQAEFGGGQGGAGQKTTKLNVFSSADGAHVYVDGRSVGDVPFVGPVSPGKHTISVRLEGFVSSQRDVVVDEGTTQTLPMPLVERPVGVAFDTTPGADVYVDGRFTGRAPFGPEGVPLPPGNHVAVVVKNGKRLATKEFTLVRNKPMLVSLPLETSNQRVSAFVIGGIGLGALLTSGVFYAIAIAEESRVENRQALLDRGELDAKGLTSYNTALANRDAFRTSGTVIGFGGVAALTGGVLLYALDKPDPNSVPIRPSEDPKKPKNEFDVAVTPYFTGQGLGLGAMGRF
jgi:hypothetical protein